MQDKEMHLHILSPEYSVPKLQSFLGVRVENSGPKRLGEWKIWRKIWHELDLYRKQW